MKGYKRAWLKHIEAGVEGLMKYRAPSATADYSIVREDGKVFAHLNGACHAALGYKHAIRGRPILCITGIQDRAKNLTKEEKLMLISYLTKKSPWKDAYVHKDAARILRQGYFVVHGGVKSHILGGACVATRTLCEHFRQAKVFCALVRNGVEENLAFVLAYSCHTDGSSYIKWGEHVGHSVLNTVTTSLCGVKSFLSGVSPLDNAQSTWYESGSYDGYSRNAWVGKHDGSWGRLLESIEVEKLAKEQSTNPFIKSLEKEMHFTHPFDLSIKAMVDNIDMISERVRNA